eukprot:TRINITY_DN4516_c5_g1_i1.p1 TRINITY_DN4516_c5_g1~~TRINITY_DN4516_c5_g1_i1.p1  ORF type:complete len:286 (-),score=108.42 TRINITY_DN4516_c5_g1_i1:35-892(-)
MSYLESQGFKNFKSWVALQTINIEQISSEERKWKFYDWGPRDVTPLVLLPCLSGLANSYFRQFLSLCPKGFRIIAIQPPGYPNISTFVKGLDTFLSTIGVDKVHLFGSSLGGFLAQVYAQVYPERVISLILNNTFSSTNFFAQRMRYTTFISLLPAFALQRMILETFPQHELPIEVALSVDFMVLQLDQISQSELASRLTILSTSFNITKSPIDPSKITFIEVLDDVSLPEEIREQTFGLYPNCKVAQIKSGGNFPFLANADEFNLHIVVHLRANGTFPNQIPTL